MTLYAFEEAWYAGIIERYAPDVSEEGAAIAHSNLVAACIIAQSIDGLSKSVKELSKNAEGIQRAVEAVQLSIELQNK